MIDNNFDNNPLLAMAWFMGIYHHVFENLSYLEFCFNGSHVTYNVGVNMSLIVLGDEENENDFKVKTVFHLNNINTNKNNIIKMICKIGLQNWSLVIFIPLQFSNVIEIYLALNCFLQIQWMQYFKRIEKRELLLSIEESLYFRFKACSYKIINNYRKIAVDREY